MIRTKVVLVLAAAIAALVLSLLAIFSSNPGDDLAWGVFALAVGLLAQHGVDVWQRGPSE